MLSEIIMRTETKSDVISKKAENGQSFSLAETINIILNITGLRDEFFGTRISSAILALIPSYQKNRAP